MKFLFLILITFNVYAFEEIFKLGDHFLPFIVMNNKHIVISKNCKHLKCDAIKILKKISYKHIPTNNGGMNPGSALCNSIPNSKNIVLKTLSGNEQSFCMMKDKSMISTGSLEFYANKNDRNKK